MRVSQLLKVMDKEDEIYIDDFDAKIDKMHLYDGAVKGIKKEDPINKMHVVSICAEGELLLVLASEQKEKGGKQG